MRVQPRRAGQPHRLDDRPRDRLGDQLAEPELGSMEALRFAAPETRVVYASTRQIYGRPQYLPVDERHPLCPTDVNGINKQAGEQYHLLYADVYGLPTVAIRLTNTYGPRQLMHHGRQGFIPVFIRSAMEGREITLYGGVEQVRDANYVDEVGCLHPPALGLMSSTAGCSTPGHGPHSACAPSPRRCWRSSAPVRSPRRTGRWKRRIDIGDFEADHSRITAELGWQPTVSLADGLRRTVDFYREHGEEYW